MAKPSEKKQDYSMEANLQWALDFMKQMRSRAPENINTRSHK